VFHFSKNSSLPQNVLLVDVIQKEKPDTPIGYVNPSVCPQERLGITDGRKQNVSTINDSYLKIYG
jgi:hypothetical protein